MNDEENSIAELRLTFKTEGWKILLKGLEEEAELLNDLYGIDTLEQLHFRKGQLHVLQTLINYEYTLEVANESY